MLARRLVIALGLGGTLAPGAAAQDSSFVTVDRVVAVVGSTPIPASRIEEELNVVRSQRGADFPTDSASLAQFRQEILQQIVDDELIIQAAQRDTSVRVTDQDVQLAVDQALQEVRRQFASDLEYERELRRAGFGSPNEYRRWLTEQKRRELLRDGLLNRLRQTGEITPLPPTEAELREFFERTKGRQPQRPATVSLRQIIVRPTPDSAALRATFRLADSVAQALRKGADFEAAARRFSQDPGSREQGGLLGWVRRGQLVPEFEAFAFRLRPGVVSPPIETPFGLHIIKVDRSQPAEVLVRHILFVPEITEPDLARARARAEDVAEILRTGTRFDSLVRTVHDGREASLLEDVPRDSLPVTYREALAGAGPGDVAAPVELASVGGQPPRYAAILLLEERPAGELQYEDLRDLLRTRLTQENAMQRYLEKLRKSTYVDIRL